jgi:hypothetical protein
MFTLPLVTLIPQNAPPEVDEVLVVVKLNPLIVLPCTEEGVLLPTERKIPLYITVVAAVIVVVPVPVGEAKPITLLETLKAFPSVLVIKIALCVVPVV